MNYPYLSLTGAPETYQSPYAQEPAPFPSTMVTTTDDTFPKLNQRAQLLNF